MILGVMAVLVMVLVFAMGATLMELLFRDAPRRGKRPDMVDEAPNSRTVLRVTTTDGETVVGDPLYVIRQLRNEGYRFSPCWTNQGAENVLLQWEREGRIQIRGEWREI